jgi:hypothetical protein
MRRGKAWKLALERWVTVADLIIIYCDKCGKRIPPDAEKMGIKTDAGADGFLCSECTPPKPTTTTSSTSKRSIKVAESQLQSSASKSGVLSKSGTASKSGVVSKSASMPKAFRERSSTRRAASARGDKANPVEKPSTLRSANTAAKTVFYASAAGLGALFLLIIILVALGEDKGVDGEKKKKNVTPFVGASTESLEAKKRQEPEPEPKKASPKTHEIANVPPMQTPKQKTEPKVVPKKEIHAETISVYADSTLQVAGGTDNEKIFGGMLAEVWVQDAGSGLANEAYLRFDLSGLPNKILSAQLRLYPLSVGQDCPPQAAAYVPDDDWQEHKVCWLNKPLSADALGTWKPTAGAAVELDVSTVLSRIIANGKRFAVRLYAPEKSTGEGGVKYAGRNTPKEQRPKLSLKIAEDDLLAMPPLKVLDLEAAAKELTVRFNEPLLAADAERTDNYVLDKGPSVKTVRLSEDGKIVTLTLEAEPPAGELVLKFKQIRSRWSEKRSLPLDAQFTFTASSKPPPDFPAKIAPKTQEEPKIPETVAQNPVPAKIDPEVSDPTQTTRYVGQGPLKSPPALELLQSGGTKISWTAEGFLEIHFDFSDQRQTGAWQRGSGRVGWENGACWIEGVAANGDQPAQNGAVLYSPGLSGILVDAKFKVQSAAPGGFAFLLRKNGENDPNQQLVGLWSANRAALRLGAKDIAAANDDYPADRPLDMDVFYTADKNAVWTINGVRIGGAEFERPFVLGILALGRERLWLKEAKFQYELSPFGLNLLKMSVSERDPKGNREAGLLFEVIDDKGNSIHKSATQAAVYVHAPQNPGQKLQTGLTMQWSGFLLVPTTGKYAFSLQENGAAVKVLRIGANTVSDVKRLQSEKGVELRLNAGVQPFVLQVGPTKTDEPRIVLSWHPPGEVKGLIAPLHWVKNK